MQYTESEERQKSFILEFSKLGMDFYSAAVAAECSPAFIDTLESDAQFQSDIQFAVAMREKELLERLNKTAILNASSKGDTKAMERLLEILNPDRYSKTTKLAHQIGSKGKGKSPSAIKIEFVGTEGDGEDY